MQISHMLTTWASCPACNQVRYTLESRPNGSTDPWVVSYSGPERTAQVQCPRMLFLSLRLGLDVSIANFCVSSRATYGISRTLCLR